MADLAGDEQGADFRRAQAGHRIVGAKRGSEPRHREGEYYYGLGWIDHSAVGGAVGGYGTGRVARNVSINPAVDAIAGLIGGSGGTWLAGMIPALVPMVTGGGAAYAGQAVTGVVGGGILTAIARHIKNMTMP